MTSTAPTPKGSQEQSTTEKRLQELLAKRADVVSGGVPDRNIQARGRGGDVCLVCLSCGRYLFASGRGGGTGKRARAE